VSGLKECRQKRTLGENVDGDQDQDIMNVLLSLLDGTTIEGFDCDTIIKATILVCIYFLLITFYIY
jgi:hypothetical protein